MKFVENNVSKTIVMPWNHSAIGSFNRDLGDDIKKEDGWTMLAYSNTPFANMPNTLFSMLLYNQKTGDLKIFYYWEGDILGHKTGFWQVYFRSPQGWMNSANDVTMPIGYQIVATDNYYWQTSILSSPNMGSFQTGWNVVVIPNLNYDPQASKTQHMVIDTYGEQYYLTNIFGTSTGSTSGYIMSQSTVNPLAGIEKKFKTLTGNAIDNWKWNIGDQTRGLIIGGLIEKGVKGLLKAGINLCSGKFFGIFSRKVEQPYSVSLTTTMKSSFSGTTWASSGTGIPSKGFEIGSDATGLELGVWNLKENPTVYIHPVGVLSEMRMGDQYDEWTYKFRNSDNYKVDVVINPSIMSHVKKYWTECSIVRYYGNNIPEPFKPVNDYGPLGSHDSQGGAFPAGDEDRQIYKDSVYDIHLTNLSTNCTYHRIWNKHGKPSYNEVV